MIATLRGRLIYSDGSSVVIECGGVGLKCSVTKNTFNKLPKEGEELFLYTHLAVREDAMDLYGFYELDELNTFKLLTSVNGVGAKMGIALLSEFTASQLTLYIAGNDPKALTAASGVGTKLAQRIVLELKDKVGSLAVADTAEIKAVGNAVSDTAASEAVEALVALGYSKGEASLTVGKLDSGLTTDELIRQALKFLARR